MNALAYSPVRYDFRCMLLLLKVVDQSGGKRMLDQIRLMFTWR